MSIELGEIEAALSAHPSVREAVVLLQKSELSRPLSQLEKVEKNKEVLIIKLIIII